MPTVLIDRPVGFSGRLLFSICFFSFLGALSYQGMQAVGSSSPHLGWLQVASGMFVVYALVSVPLALLTCAIISPLVQATPMWFRVVVQSVCFFISGLCTFSGMILINDRVAGDFIGFYDVMIRVVHAVMAKLPA